MNEATVVFSEARAEAPAHTLIDATRKEEPMTTASDVKVRVTWHPISPDRADAIIRLLAHYGDIAEKKKASK